MIRPVSKIQHQRLTAGGLANGQPQKLTDENREVMIKSSGAYRVKRFE